MVFPANSSGFRDALGTTSSRPRKILGAQKKCDLFSLGGLSVKKFHMVDEDIGHAIEKRGLKLDSTLNLQNLNLDSIVPQSHLAMQ